MGLDLLAEGLPHPLRLFPQLDRAREVVGNAGRIGDIGVALEGRLELEPSIDAVESRRDDARDSEIGVDVATRHAVLQAQRWAVAHQAQRARAVVASPLDGRGREGALDVALVGVDLGSEEQGQLLEVRELSGDEGTTQRGHPVGGRVVGHDHRPVEASEGQVDMAGVALALVVLRHEG